MAARALPNPARGVPGLVVLPAGGYRRVRAESLLRPKEPPALVTHELPGLGAVRAMRTAGFEARAGGYVALGLLAAELSRRGVAAGLAELDAGLHAGAGVLRVDGGMSASDWTMQALADTLDLPVDRPHSLETTARGAAYLAGLDAGLYPEPEVFAAGWQAERRFTPHGDSAVRARRRAGWQDAVRRSRS